MAICLIAAPAFAQDKQVNVNFVIISHDGGDYGFSDNDWQELLTRQYAEGSRITFFPA